MELRILLVELDSLTPTLSLLPQLILHQRFMVDQIKYEMLQLIEFSLLLEENQLDQLLMEQS